MADAGLVEISELQWGRGFSAAETIHSLPSPLSISYASMGPRLFSRGNHERRASAGTLQDRFNGAAAFQPRKLL